MNTSNLEDPLLGSHNSNTNPHVTVPVDSSRSSNSQLSEEDEKTNQVTTNSQTQAQVPPQPTTVDSHLGHRLQRVHHPTARSTRLVQNRLARRPLLAQPRPRPHFQPLRHSEERPFIIDDYLGPYSKPKVSKIQFDNLIPYVKIIIKILDEKLDAAGYKAYMIYLLIISCAHLVPVIYYCVIIQYKPVIAVGILIIFPHFACALWQSHLEHEAIRKRDGSLSEQAIFVMKTHYVILSSLLICTGLIVYLVGSVYYNFFIILVMYILLFLFHLFITLVGAYKADKILLRKMNLKKDLDAFPRLKALPSNHEDRYFALFGLLHRLSEKDTLFPIPNKHKILKKESHAWEYTETVNRIAETIRTIAEHIPGTG